MAVFGNGNALILYFILGKGKKIIQFLLGPRIEMLSLSYGYVQRDIKYLLRRSFWAHI